MPLGVGEVGNHHRVLAVTAALSIISVANHTIPFEKSSGVELRLGLRRFYGRGGKRLGHLFAQFIGDAIAAAGKSLSEFIERAKAFFVRMADRTTAFVFGFRIGVGIVPVHKLRHRVKDRTIKTGAYENAECCNRNNFYQLHTLILPPGRRSSFACLRASTTLPIASPQSAFSRTRSQRVISNIPTA